MQDNLATEIGVVIYLDMAENSVLVKNFLSDKSYTIPNVNYGLGEFLELVLVDGHVISHGKYNSYRVHSGTVQEILENMIQVIIQNQIIPTPRNLFEDTSHLQLNTEVTLYSNSQGVIFYVKCNTPAPVQHRDVKKEALISICQCLGNLLHSKKIDASDLSPEVWSYFAYLTEDPDLRDPISGIYKQVTQEREITLDCGHHVRKAALIVHVSDSTNGLFVLTRKEKEVFYIGCPQCSYFIRDHIIQDILEDRYQGAYTQMKLREKGEEKMYDCQICYNGYRMEEMITLDCDHYFCSECSANHISSKIQDSQVDINCPLCNQEIKAPVIESLVPPKMWDYYVMLVLKKDINITECPRCHLQFVSDERNVNCQCGHSFCSMCLRDVHYGTCDQEQIRSVISQLEGGGVMFAQCPNCKMHFTKDENCEHVKCTQCETEFCFQCSCLRSPTLAHGTHYHRPQCKFYADFKGNDGFSMQCSECVKGNRLCSRPNNLQEARKFNEGEV